MQIIKFFAKHSLLFYLIVGIVIAAFMAFASGLLNQYRLANHANLTTGSVVQPQCDQHLRFSYQFVVNDVAYQGLATSDQCRQTKSGDPVLVHYLAENPRVSMGSDPKDALINNVITILIASLIIPLVLLLIFWFKLREWRKAAMIPGSKSDEQRHY